MSSGAGQGSRVARAATRYRPGKAPVNAGAVTSSDDDDDSDEDSKDRRRRKELQKRQQYDRSITNVSSGTAALKDSQRRTAGVIIQSGGNGSMKPVVRLDNVVIGGKRGNEEQVEDDESDEYETDTDDERAGSSVPSKPIFKKPGAPMPKDESSEYETDSEEEEESDEDKRPVMLKPIFVSKKQRETLRPIEAEDVVMGELNSQNGAEEILDADTHKARALAEERRKQSHLLAANTIKRELAEKDHEDAQPDLSDTDGKDPEEEFQAWRIRELSRLKLEKETTAAKEVEREEIERRRAMPEAQRLAEDTARADQSRLEKRREREAAAAADGGGGGNFMQKYHHKGSFFQDMDILKNRDYSAKTESAVDMSLLPKVMQVRDYGKAGRSKYTHLSNEDTSRKQQDHRMKGISGADGYQQSLGAGQQCFTCGGPHLRRDCPQANTGAGRGGNTGGRGANTIPLRDRDHHRRGDARPRSPIRRREDEPSSYRDR
ncbi:hypothetical protein CBS101457_003665 [Exobasidium rhododendri]|nr:hypothetical protein CBS101457_003665 [Exobasidium rhododendri]